jgi:hypothetical protein
MDYDVGDYKFNQVNDKKWVSTMNQQGSAER